MLVWWIIIATLFVAAAALFVTSVRQEAAKGVPIMFTSLGVGVLAILLSLVAGYMQVMPSYRVWKANQEKRIQVTDATAKADAAVEQARAEVERAKGTAEANQIVAGSITEPYLRYLYINGLINGGNQVIYVPTEAGLPILEAGRTAK